MGNSKEMDYVQQSIEKEVLTRQAKDANDTKDACFYVYSTRVNEDQTSDGIIAGGERVAQELNSLLHDKNLQGKDVTLSFVGNSLGGLYARYALSQIDALQPESPGLHNSSTTSASNNSIRSLEPKVFITTATPHLGVSEHTYLPIPRFAEDIISSTMKPTGRDLFRFNNVIERMATDPVFLRPLQRFQKRIAYANAYYTDFQVPTATAAFLSETNSIHVRVNRLNENLLTSFRLFVQTQPKPLLSEASKAVTLSDMARNLDNLGWTKVFCDVRSFLWSIPVPKRIYQRGTVWEESKETYTSSELLHHYANIHDRFALPFGHTMLIANAKNGFFEWLNAGGRPIVHQIAEDLVDEILRES
jgi:hypothetical protein